MSYLDDLKKKAQGVVNTVQNVGNAAYNGVKQVYNATQNAGQNIYNAATGNTQQKPQTQAPSTQPSAAVQQQQEQANRDHAAHMNQMQQNQVDWAAEYDKAMAPQTTPTTSAQPGGQAAQPPTSAAAQSALGEGAGQWQAELDNVMAQIMGKGKFDYNMNGDAMYQQYADIYQNQANLGMQNAMAQAAALTGGYGSSYGQMVGQQAYAQQMQGLNDIGLELYDRAYAQDMAERSQLMDQYNMLAAREEQAYNRAYQEGRDKVADDQWDKTHNWQLEQFDKLYGDEGFYATESQKDREQQTILQNDSQEHDKDMQSTDHTNSLEILDKQHTNTKELQDDSQAHDITLQTNDQTHDKNMATQEHDWQVEEWDKMYGDLVYDDEGNIIGGGYQTKKDHQDQENWETENEQDQKQFDSLYGYTDENGVFHEGYYATESQKDRNHQTTMQEDSQTFNKEMTTQQHDWQVEEWDKMYGENGYMTKKDKQDQENWQAEFDREGEWYDAAQEASKTTTTYAGNSNYIGNDTEVPKQLAGVDGLTTTNTNLFDDNGNFKQAAVVSAYGADGKSVDGKGNAITPSAGVGTMTYNVGGKEIKVQTGTSPYTNTVNPDAKNGVMANGYQPNNIGGSPLTETDWEYPVNGQWVPTYTTPDGTEYAYDAANNTYIPVPAELRGGSSSTDKNLSGKVNPNFSYAYK
jgi:hypothetical protein